MVVTDPFGAELFDDVQSIGFDEALRRAVAEDSELRPRRQGPCRAHPLGVFTSSDGAALSLAALRRSLSP